MSTSTMKVVRFYLQLKSDHVEQPVWSVVRKLSDKIGERLTDHLRALARENPSWRGYEMWDVECGKTGWR